MAQYIVHKGTPLCLSRGFESLKSGSEWKTIKTIDYEKQRLFKLIDITEFDAVFNVYRPLGKHWADVVTGSLYNPKTGKCLSSDQIKLLVNHAI